MAVTIGRVTAVLVLPGGDQGIGGLSLSFLRTCFLGEKDKDKADMHLSGLGKLPCVLSLGRTCWPGSRGVQGASPSPALPWH